MCEQGVYDYAIVAYWDDRDTSDMVANMSAKVDWGDGSVDSLSITASGPTSFQVRVDACCYGQLNA